MIDIGEFRSLWAVRSLVVWWVVLENQLSGPGGAKQQASVYVPALTSLGNELLPGSVK